MHQLARRCKKVFDAKEFVENSTREIRETVGKSRVISACSGGVDSTVVTYLMHKAVKEQLLAVFVDDGLRRQHEPEFVMNTLRKLGIQAKYVDAKKEFFAGSSTGMDSKKRNRKPGQIHISCSEGLHDGQGFRRPSGPEEGSPLSW